MKILNTAKHGLPSYSTNDFAGIYIKANIDSDIIHRPLQRFMIPISLYLEIPVRFEAQIRPGMEPAIEIGTSIVNSPGTIDADYQGMVCIILIYLSDNNLAIKEGERICQMIIDRNGKEE